MHYSCLNGIKNNFFHFILVLDAICESVTLTLHTYTRVFLMLFESK